MSSDQITLALVCLLLVAQQVLHQASIRGYRKQSEMMTKLLAARNYSEYSLGEARQKKADRPQQPEKGYDSAFTE